ncbi:hypothetical protein [Gemmiger sp. An194]|uniref:hypothetical protein n=1 Tax=Gemmiger sp. An194 TaxID=1965582 RepID=UPI00117A558A|nr:hypothetical protein [Gemmiger sp. An194]
MKKESIGRELFHKRKQIFYNFTSAIELFWAKVLQCVQDTCCGLLYAMNGQAAGPGFVSGTCKPETACVLAGLFPSGGAKPAQRNFAYL